jgi:uncharacterized repeat protein (TIGR01451 family)
MFPDGLASVQTGVPGGKRRARKMLLAGAVAVLSLVMLTAQVATAAKPPSPPPSTVVTNTNDSGPGSLRQVLVDAPAGSTITFANNVSGVITLTSGELDATKDVTIHGPGAQALAISGNHASRILFNPAGVTTTISGLTVRDGRMFCCQSGGGNPSPYGGGISNFGTLTIIDSTLSGNEAEFGGGAIDNCGFCGGSLTIVTSKLEGNQSAGAGGAIWNDSGTVNVTDTTLAGNHADSSGGGVASVGTLRIASSTLHGNTAGSTTQAGSGGGIANWSTATVLNSTLVDNFASGAGGGGGAIQNLGNMTVTNATLSGNGSGGVGGGIQGAYGLSLANSIVVQGDAGPNCQGVIDGGNNISFPASDISCPAGFSSGDPVLEPLQANGGATFTEALGPGSAATDAGNNSLCSSAVSGRDQRGAARGADGNADGLGGCDIGAFELNDADLGVQVAASASVKGGATMEYVITVTNHGPLGDPAVVLQNTIPAGTKFLQYTTNHPSVGCTAPAKNSQVVRCHLGELLTGASSGLTITIRVAVQASSPIQNVVRVSGSRFDSNGSNNVAGSNTAVTK